MAEEFEGYFVFDGYLASRDEEGNIIFDEIDACESRVMSGP